MVASMPGRVTWYPSVRVGAFIGLWHIDSYDRVTRLESIISVVNVDGKPGYLAIGIDMRMEIKPGSLESVSYVLND